MSPDEISALSLGEIEAIAQRLDAAAKVFRDARSLLGGHGVSVHSAGQPATAPAAERSSEPQSPTPETEDAAAAHRRRQFQPPENPNGKHPHLNAAEVQQRNALLGRARDPGMDEDIARAMESE